MTRRSFLSKEITWAASTDKASIGSTRGKRSQVPSPLKGLAVDSQVQFSLHKFGWHVP